MNSINLSASPAIVTASSSIIDAIEIPFTDFAKIHAAF
jgi:hypothetical protein